MAQRKIKQPQRARPRTGVPPRKPGGETLEGLRRERDSLRQDLTAATAEIERLRELQSQVLDRIDWIIDSLNSLSQDKP
jgi:hypothetical protein